jgi:hypothetical protein
MSGHRGRHGGRHGGGHGLGVAALTFVLGYYGWRSLHGWQWHIETPAETRRNDWYVVAFFVWLTAFPVMWVYRQFLE